MKIKFDTVYERDVDLLVINSFSLYDDYKKLFGFDEYNIEEIIHSLSDNSGESDITIIFSKDSLKIGLLIEDKINAPAMPEQRKRYNDRGENGKKEGLYDDFRVFIIAPKEYLDNNQEAQKYENRISYEALLDYYKSKNNEYAINLIERSIEKKGSGYDPVPDEMKTNNWKILYKYVDDNFPNLRINHLSRDRGPSAVWPLFKCPIKNYLVYFKSNRDVVDLTIPHGVEMHKEINELLKNNLDKDMSIVETGKSLAVRINVPHIDFNQNFNKQLNNLHICLESISRLYDLFDKVDFQSLSKYK